MDNSKKYWIAFGVVYFLLWLIKPSLGVLAMGIIAIYLGIRAILFQSSMVKKGIRWTGSIIEFQSSGSGHKTPIIEFTTMAGEYIREKPTLYGSTDLSIIRTYRKLINQTVPILYDPNQPKKFILVNERGVNYVVCVALLLIGLFFVRMGIKDF